MRESTILIALSLCNRY